MPDGQEVAAPLQADLARAVDQLADKIQNMGADPKVKSIPGPNYKIGNDFDQWASVYQDTVRTTHKKPIGDRELPALYLYFISTKLEVGPTRQAYDNLPDASKVSWATLRGALEQAFRNEEEQILFLSDERHYKRGNMSLRDYKNGLLHRMDKYQRRLRNVPEEWEKTAMRRFRGGLENPILEAQILMNCVGDKHTLDCAYDIASNFENTIKHLSQSNTKETNALMGMLGISQLVPQAAALGNLPQMAAMSPTQEKLENRMSDMEMIVRKNERSIAGLDSGVSEIKGSIKTLADHVVTAAQTPMRTQQYGQQYNPQYNQRFRFAPPRQSWGYQSNNRAAYPRFGPNATRASGPFPGPSIVPGLSVAGWSERPGFVQTPQYYPTPRTQMKQYQHPTPQTQLYQPPGTPQNQPYQPVRVPLRVQGSGESGKIPVSDPSQPSLKSSSDASSMPQMASMSESDKPGEDVMNQQETEWPNPCTQSGVCDLGYGWQYHESLAQSQAQAEGYDINPSGRYVYTDSDMSFY